MVQFLKSVKGKITVAASVLTMAAVVVLVILLNTGGGYRNISIAEIYGSVLAENNGSEYQAYKNLRLADGYVLTTDIDSYTRMLLDDDKYVKLEQDSRACFERVGKDSSRRTAIRLERVALTTEITSELRLSSRRTATHTAMFIPMAARSFADGLCLTVLWLMKRCPLRQATRRPSEWTR